MGRRRKHHEGKKKRKEKRRKELNENIIYHTGYRTTLETAIHTFLLIYIYFNAIHDIINKNVRDIQHVKDGTSEMSLLSKHMVRLPFLNGRDTKGNICCP